MGLFTFETNNRMYMQAVVELEAMKAELSLFEIEIMKSESRKMVAEENASLIEKSLDFVCKYAKIVSITEYSKLKFQLASEYHSITNESNYLVATARTVSKLKVKIEKMERVLPNLSSIVLRFPSND